MTPPPTAVLVDRATDGDGTAWDELVDRYAKVVWSVARGHGLGPSDAADVSQTTWLRLAENLARLKEPDRVGSWLVTTARRESLRVLRRGQRQVPSGVDLLVGVPGSDDIAPDASVIRRERDAVLWRAFKALPALCRSLLGVLMSDPQPSYAEISEALDMPVGSIGPRRARCLDRLRIAVELEDGRPRRVEVAAG